MNLVHITSVDACAAEDQWLGLGTFDIWGKVTFLHFEKKKDRYSAQ